jgi:hypothetical protein
MLTNEARSSLGTHRAQPGRRGHPPEVATPATRPASSPPPCSRRSPRTRASDPARSASVCSERTAVAALAAAVLPVHGQVLAPAELLQTRGEEILDPLAGNADLDGGQPAPAADPGGYRRARRHQHAQPDPPRYRGRVPAQAQLCARPERSARCRPTRLKSIAVLVMLTGLWARSGAFCRCSRYHKVDRKQPRCWAPDPGGLPSKARDRPIW